MYIMLFAHYKNYNFYIVKIKFVLICTNHYNIEVHYTVCTYIHSMYIPTYCTEITVQ